MFYLQTIKLTSFLFQFFFFLGSKIFYYFNEVYSEFDNINLYV